MSLETNTDKVNRRLPFAIFNPDNSLIKTWNFMIGMITLWCIVYNPLRIAFGDRMEDQGILTKVDILVQVTFMVDIILGFITAIRDNET